MVTLNTDIQTPINSNSISDTNSFTLNSSTSTKIADVRIKSDGRPDRSQLVISNSGNQDIWVKLQAASVDDLKEGIFLAANSDLFVDSNGMYTGEISAIAVNGTPTISVVEY